jgi:hypothetical protein
MPDDDHPADTTDATIAILLLTAGSLMEDAGVTAVAARPTVGEVNALAAAGADIAALTSAAAVLARAGRNRPA